MVVLEGLDNAYPLTPVQQGMLYEVLKHADTDVYVAYIVIDITGPLDADILRLAWHRTLQHHETLRTRFLWEGLDEPMQLVNSNVHLDWQQVNRRDVEHDDVASEVERWLEIEKNTPLEISNTPPIRFRLINIDTEFSVQIWTVHHLLADDWSTPLVLKTLADAYRELGSGTAPSITTYNTPESDAAGQGAKQTPRFQYISYVDWLAQSDTQKHRSYWQQQLKDFQPSPLAVMVPEQSAISELELGKKQVRTDHYRCETSLSVRSTDAILALSRQHGVTLSSIMHVAWALVVSRYSSQTRAVFGTSVSGRSSPLENLDTAVGLFLNTQPTIIDTSFTGPLGEFLRQTQTQLFEQLAHEDLPLAEIQKFAPAEYQQSLFDTVLVVESHGPELEIRIDEPTISFANIRYVTDSNYPLTVLVFPGQKLHVHVVSTSEKYPPSLVQALSRELELVMSDLSDPAVQQLTDVLDRQDYRATSASPVTDTLAPAPHATMDAWIASACDQYPDNICVIDGDGEHSYAKLKSLGRYCANQIADYHRTLPEDFGDVACSRFVGIFLRRGFAQIAAITGVLESGCAYVPLDPDWPEVRLQAMLQDARIKVVLTDTTLKPRLKADVHAVLVTEYQTAAASMPVTDSEPAGKSGQVAADDPAYMIYTSGSTGKAKGVVISHQNLVYSTQARIQYYPHNPERYLLLSSFAFDSSVAGIFWALCSGGTLVLPAYDQERDVHELEQIIDRNRVSHTLCLPSLYALLLRYADTQNLLSMKSVIVAGEACSANLVQLHQKTLPHAQLFNEYGPTEATVWSTVSQLHPRTGVEADYTQVPIGIPIPGSTVSVIDARGRICPAGVIGEIQVSGPGVSPGYHRNKEQTDARFVPVGGGDTTRNRAYRTGDNGLLGPDGQFYFVGRTDTQLKVRGYRIEPGEIEMRVERHPGVLQAICTLVKPKNGNPVATEGRLVCFYTLADGSPQPDDSPPAGDSRLLSDPSLQSRLTEINDQLQSVVEAELPPQFRVSRFVAVSQIPLLPNGKVDYQAFPEPFTDPAVRHDHTSQQSGSAEALQLCAILAGLLGVEKAGLQDNFFALGGDSLSAIRFVAAAREAGLFISIPMISQFDTLDGLADAMLQQMHNTDKGCSEQDWHASAGPTPLSPVQRWFFSSGHPQPQHWNMACYFDLQDNAPVQLVVDAVRQSVEAHHVLGACFDIADTDVRQVIPDNIHADPLIYVESEEQLLRQHAETDLHQAIVSRLCQLQSEFVLSQGSLIRLLVITAGQDEVSRIAWVAHHLVTDALSNWHFAQQINQHITAINTVALADAQADSTNLTENQSGQLPVVLSRPYRDWALRINSDDSQTVCQISPVSLANWQESSVLIHSQVIEYAELEALRNLCREQSVGLHECVLYALLRSAIMSTALQSVRVDVETHGRDVLAADIDVSSSLGWFSHFFALDYSAPQKQTQASPKSVGSSLSNIAQLIQFRDSYREQKQNPAQNFATSPESFFSTELPAAERLALLYNYLAFQFDDSALQLVSLTEPCFRAANSVRSHALEILVKDHPSGICINWHTDTVLNTSLDIPAWKAAFKQTLRELLDAADQSSVNFSPEDFPDVDMDADELNSFLDSLE